MLLETENSCKFDLLDILIHLDTRFAIYRLPFSNEPTLVVQTSKMANNYHNIQELTDIKGFVIAPFRPDGKTKAIISISPEVRIKGGKEIDAFLENISKGTTCRPKDQSLPKNNNNCSAGTSMEGYSAMFRIFMRGLEKQGLSKLVLSRTLSYPRRETFSAGQSFGKALAQNANSFVYLCHSPETGTWLGSSPEMLLSGKDQDWKTVALAGTKPISEIRDWDQKNRIEQDIVVRFVEEQLDRANISNVNKTRPNVIEAGNVAHLKSDFGFRIRNKEQIGTILQLLHPTPAVCGYPKEIAYDYIIKHEQHDRRYYSGFVGYMDGMNETDLYVNLRCMEIRQDDLLLYAGGGILPSSEMESEWDETENKLQTMLSIIRE